MTQTRPRRDVRDADRAVVLARGECQYCGDLRGPFEVDHVKPMARGGTSALANLACACVSCNTQKRSHLLHEWIMYRRANGMPWPPPASHATDPVHYGDLCEACRVMPPSRAYDLQYDGNRGYRAYFRCPCGYAWTCWFALAAWYYSDCPCTYCACRRIEESA